MKPPETLGRAAYLSAMISLASAALGVIAALAWNAAITELFKAIFPPASGIVSLFVYAIIVSVIAISVMVMLANAAKRMNE